MLEEGAESVQGPDQTMESEPCIRMLKALADDTRWSIVRELLKRTLTVGEISERVNASQYNISKHLRILREAGIVETSKEGKSVNCRVAESLREHLSKNKRILNLGCCSFRFADAKSSR